MPAPISVRRPAGHIGDRSDRPIRPTALTDHPGPFSQPACRHRLAPPRLRAAAVLALCAAASGCTVSSAGKAAPTASLLRGPEWVVEDLDRAGIIDRSRASLEFGPDGRLSGRTSCNTYVARYALTGEGIGVTGIVATDTTCAPALMRQEQRFLDALARTEGFELTRDGALVLHGAGHRILARRP